MRVLQERGPVPALSPRRLALVGVTAATVVAVDQVTKAWALRTLDDRSIHLVWTLRLHLSFNSGAAFGVGRGLAPLLVVVAVVVLVVLVSLAGRTATTPLGGVALGLVLGGAVGNLADRVLGGHGGAVVDFIDLQWWPVFNVADAAISCGALLLVVAGAGRRAGPA